MKNNYFAICLAVLFSAGVQAELSARQIMEKVDQNVRQSNDSAFSVSVLSSCRFVQRDRQVVCSDQPRVKKLETVSKQYGRQLKDSRVISVVLEPAPENMPANLMSPSRESGVRNIRRASSIADTALDLVID